MSLGPILSVKFPVIDRIPLPQDASDAAKARHADLQAAHDVLDSKANAPAKEKAEADLAVRVAISSFLEQSLRDASVGSTQAALIEQMSRNASAIEEARLRLLLVK